MMVYRLFYVPAGATGLLFDWVLTIFVPWLDSFPPIPVISSCISDLLPYPTFLQSFEELLGWHKNKATSWLQEKPQGDYLGARAWFRMRPKGPGLLAPAVEMHVGWRRVGSDEGAYLRGFLRRKGRKKCLPCCSSLMFSLISKRIKTKIDGEKNLFGGG